MRLICTILSRSGTDCAPSHLETDCRVTFSCCASSSCDQPAFFLRFMILSARIIFSSSWFLFGWRYHIRSGGCMPEIRLSNLSTGGCISVFYYRNPCLPLSRRLFFPFFVQLRAISGIFYISFTNCSPHRPGNPVSLEHKEAASRKHPRKANSDLSNRLRFSISPLSFSLISLTETQPVK